MTAVLMEVSTKLVTTERPAEITTEITATVLLQTHGHTGVLLKLVYEYRTLPSESVLTNGQWCWIGRGYGGHGWN